MNRDTMEMTVPSAPSPQPHHSAPVHQSFWLWVMCLTGVDYFSTLGYQPSIAFEATGLLTPFATMVLVIMTLCGALPVYAHVAAESPHGQGSIAMLERLLRGWTGKILVLTLLGFAATDFVITKTLSAADAAKHLIDNPLWRDFTESARAVPVIGEAFGLLSQQLWLTFFLLIMLGAMFLRGFREVIGLAAALVGLYLLLNAIIIVSCLLYIGQNPGLVEHWAHEVAAGHWHVERSHWPASLVSGTDWIAIALMCLLLFPKLALGLSGFETGIAVMPFIKGDKDDDAARPQGRIRNARKLLLLAAIIMSVNLLGASVVTSTLIPPEELVLRKDADGNVVHSGKAVERALAYLAHSEGREVTRISPIFGTVFGTLYDLSTVAILWFAGASAMAGLLHLVPNFLPRYGMAPEWARAIRPLVVLFTLINLVVTLIFQANVTAQGGAYATGVLVLMSSACLATVIHIWHKSPQTIGAHLARAGSLAYFLIVTLAFFFTTVMIIIEKPSGIAIGACFIVSIWVSSFISRLRRSTELRHTGFEFKDDLSRFLWDSIKYIEFPVLVPHRPGNRSLEEKERIIRLEHRLDSQVPIVFIEAELGDPSEFMQTPRMEVKQQEGRFILRVTRCASIPHTIAALALDLSKVGKPPEIHFGWSNESPVRANLDFLLFGQGNVPWMVRELIHKAQPDPEKQPRVVIG